MTSVLRLYLDIVVDDTAVDVLSLLHKGLVFDCFNCENEFENKMKKKKKKKKKKRNTEKKRKNCVIHLNHAVKMFIYPFILPSILLIRPSRHYVYLDPFIASFILFLYPFIQPFLSSIHAHLAINKFIHSSICEHLGDTVCQQGLKKNVIFVLLLNSDLDIVLNVVKRCSDFCTH